MAFLIPLAEVAGEAGAAGEAAGAAGGAAGAAEGGAGEAGGAGKWLSKLQFPGGGKKGSSAPADTGRPTNSASLT